MRQESASQSQWLDHAIGPEQIMGVTEVFMQRLPQEDDFQRALETKNADEVLRITTEILQGFEKTCLQLNKQDWRLLDGMIANYLLRYLQQAVEKSNVWSATLQKFLLQLKRPGTFTEFEIEYTTSLNEAQRTTFTLTDRLEL